MPAGLQPHRLPGEAPLRAQLAGTMADVVQAQRLRHQVFVEEMGARLPVGSDGLGTDLFDPFCDHLLVRDSRHGEPVAACRILTPTQAKKIGAFAAEDAFDLTRLRPIRGGLAEVDWACVAPNYRGSAAMAALWSGLGQFLQRHGCRHLIGCARTSISDGGCRAAGIYRKARESHLAPIEHRVFPRHALPLEPAAAVDFDLPPVLDAYLRLGARVCGEPAWHPEFNTADFLLIMPAARVAPGLEG